MSGYLTKIKAKIPYSDKEVDINVDGKTLILTGGNGCGKTQLLNYLNEKLHDRIIKRDNSALVQLEQQKVRYEKMIDRDGPASQSYDSWVQHLQKTVQKIDELKQPPITLSDLEGFILKHKDLKAVLLHFEAGRKSDILKPSSVTSLSSLKEKDRLSVTNPHQKKTASSLFEEFLVTSIANQAFSESKKINNDPVEAERIDKWFKKLEADLQNLFEDDELRLVFQSDTFSFEIHQPHKEPYTFQSLSSGFSSIMAVYADLITKISLRLIDPDDLTGIVLIDEIDAHLHVSIQKKILAFLKNAFPKVQFILTTHSPFVVSSVDDAVIFDLSQLKQVEDLSMYSYEAVLEGLFGVLPVSSLLQQNIEALAKLLEKHPVDVEEVQSLLEKLPEDEDSLDSESLYFVNSAKLAINKAKR
ncbi:ATPase AAA [Vibrio alginolyticus]|uniref:AAA family ATPase n=1 Tax=Vibrio TaxID=662 RepID=UPI0005AC0D39|nr:MULTISPECIES: AAA family ATPase [Vibrio]EGQ9234472.1 AAA family ATPase [Vibrio alginolyticus]ELI1597866.1 AAA family ATPase [Vibrio alginolyticus]KIP67679.1 ATPase AAA [Vibrio alginolyticus]KIP82338.1 ATPase AAA [Vibrio alginolyticus]MCR9526256.1 AAA family ATPase [Vibrio alginolyticus]